MAERKKKRYTASERRAYWMGVGFGMAVEEPNDTRQKLISNYFENMTQKDLDSWCRGLDGKVNFSKYKKH